MEVGDDVGQHRPRAGLERLLERADVEPVRLQRDREDLRAEAAQREQRAVVGRGLHHHEVAGLDEQLEEERVGLHRSVRRDHLRRLHAVLVRDPLDERPVPGGGAVGERATGVLGEGAVRGGAEVLNGDDVERRCAPGEGDGGWSAHGAPR